MRKRGVYILFFILLLQNAVFANYKSKDINNDLIITVAKNGKGQFKQIQAAINSIKSGENKNVIIKIAPGTYNEKIFLKKSKISFIGAGIDKTIITQAIARDIWRCDHNDDW